ncbi:hypothetical protein NCCP1664_23020 [Zafaria cholistanensis]|uniref:Uncharacterized protein n=1 Tax=Zafaria cholistanensis TaxID=1682741 RepID=A0A5A7NUY7_9MICC|nr:hypothetical protein [Zafaria cholistanensis]GER23807.1 hypothetical protein NCCP1664_23020 [Zafaria cholistanensis]
MGEYRLYAESEKSTYRAPSCSLCGQHRHVRWEKKTGEGASGWIPRDAGCSNEACADYRA